MIRFRFNLYDGNLRTKLQHLTECFVYVKVNGKWKVENGSF